MSGQNATERDVRIAILDDNPSTRGLAKSALERHLPCSVTVHGSIEALLSASKEEPPDLFLLDVSPGQDSGESLCRALKSEPSTEGVPIVFLSAYKEPAKRVAALNAGGADYIDKPFYPEELVARVKHHIAAHRLRVQNQLQIAEQQALLRVLCHDLVNPIFGAHSLLELKHDMGKLDDSTIKLVLSCCQSAMDVIEHVREEHQLVAVDKRVVDDTVSLEAAFEEAARTLAIKFAQKKVKLVTDIQFSGTLGLNRVVLVHSVLNNLLTNALKFSFPESQVVMRARPLAGALCLIEVIDRGIGMPPEILQRVFDEDAKVSRTGTANEVGTGFGMPLVKRYVERAGGKIEISSKVADAGDPSIQSGTTVRLTFPLVA